MTMLSAYTLAITPRKARAALPPASVPIADAASGIIKIVALANDIEVIVPKSPDMRDSDSIVIYWDGNPVGTPLDLSTVDLTDPTLTEFTLLFPKDKFPAQGTDVTGPVTYFLYDSISEDGQFPLIPVTVRFDQLAPGGTQLPPLFFTEDQLSGITVADIINGALALKVDPYFGSEAVDLVELWLGTDKDENLGSYLATTFSVVDPKLPLTVSITEADLKASPDGEKWFGYRVTDFAGNVSRLSEVTQIPVFLNLPTLDAPLVPEYDDTSLITYTDANPDLGVQIPTYDGAAVGDSIYVVYGDQTLPPYVLNDVSNDPLTTILVPYNTVAAAGNGSVTVSYWLQRANTPRINSPGTDVMVDLSTPGGPDPDPDPETPEHDNIKAPSVKCGSSDENTIEPADYGKPAVATIFRVGVDLNPIWLVDDIIQAHWGAISDPQLILPVPVTPTNAGSNITVDIPFTDVIEAEGVGEIEVYFTLTRELAAQNTVTIESPKQIVKVVSSGALPGDGQPLAQGVFPEANQYNIIVRRLTWDGTTFRIPLAGVTNIELTKNPKISYNFVGIASGDSDTPVNSPIESSRLKVDDLAITQKMLTDGYLEVLLEWSLLYKICRNGALLDYSITNDQGTSNATQKFVRMALNPGGGTCELNKPPEEPRQ